MAADDGRPPGWPAGWCFHHEDVHEPMDWRDGCQDADDVAFVNRFSLFDLAWHAVDVDERRRCGRLKRWAVCWWAHRARQVGPGVYVSRSCWACAAGRAS